MRVMVTGGAGFVGKQLVRVLKDRADVLVADLLRYGTPDWLQGELDGFSFRRVDIRDAAATRALVEEFAPDVIVHLAAIHYIPECDSDPANAVATNVTGTVNLLAACAPGTRFVFASSGAVYRPDEADHRELESVVEPVDIYGHTKHQGEIYLRVLAESRDLAGVIVRLFNVIGPGETNPHLLPAIVAQLRGNPESIALGNIWPKRDYIDVLDAASGFAAAALGNEPGPGKCEIVNLASGQQYSVSEIVDRMRSVLSLEFEVRQDERRMRAVDRPFLGADISRIRDVFGWSPQHQLDETLRRMWDNPDFLPQLEGRLT
ncbi:NAD-dependent epimerase/dehydratase family protein [Mycolicibacterium parafortuitum]|uniref:UDP-glucose 4-epimerase n=1 Tax=Mycolicibacterium parafortuitum TaxID=39692 RepID=A0A375YBK7_MYCPF|nr:NAD-dependent epimerase/dehydratase family protein [Mycolicibacterium parafortuitum]ORB31918.1 epimerase [Mycolicibacterium parafortuitum]SRX78507.1 NAD-dependent epimerase/dehydratase [Methylobacterium nodulans ORS 2060] [Mycolicibacterium parafortuitum]